MLLYLSLLNFMHQLQWAAKFHDNGMSSRVRFAINLFSRCIIRTLVTKKSNIDSQDTQNARFRHHHCQRYWEARLTASGRQEQPTFETFNSVPLAVLTMDHIQVSIQVVVQANLSALDSTPWTSHNSYRCGCWLCCGLRVLFRVTGPMRQGPQSTVHSPQSLFPIPQRDLGSLLRFSDTVKNLNSFPKISYFRSSTFLRKWSNFFRGEVTLLT